MGKGHPIFYLTIIGIIVFVCWIIYQIFSSWKSYVFVGIIAFIGVGLLRQKEDRTRNQKIRERQRKK
ncbi:hypothetical protein HN587_04670 [Candidatus Woesearchaeota archaeon]|jgi:hypothetical protein|nr:hypothetical protein [Candidatus Woesearchaeota archaeon]